MKVLVYTHRLGIRTETFIYNELTYLKDHCTLKVLINQRYNPDLFPFDNFETLPHYEHKLLGRGKAIANIALKPLGLSLNSFQDAFNKEVKEFQPNIIHLHYGTIGSRVLDYYHVEEIPIIISFHGYDASSMLENSAKYRNRLKKVLERPNVHPIFVSQFMQRKVETFGFTFNPASILYYGTDLSTFARKSRTHPKTPFKFLQVSSFSGKKGHEYTLKAFQKFTQRYPDLEVLLILAGGGVLLEEIKTLTNELGLIDKVSFKGWVSVKEAQALMEEAHAFVHHSIVSDGDREGIPNAIMEAMGMELPVISTFHSGIPELVEDGVNGYLVEERDIEHYAKRMYDIISWDFLPENRQKIEKQFERQQHGAALLGIYSKYIGK